MPVPPSRRRVLLRILLIAAAAFVILCTGTGALLAVRLDLGAYRFTSFRPYVWGTHPRGTATYSGDVIRTDDGKITLGGAHAPKPPPGTNLGTADFSASTVHTGFPRTYYAEWTLSAAEIHPTAAGPPATDTRAWTALFARALSRFRSGGQSIPDAIQRGESAGTIFAISDFSYNAGWRLLHDPLWPAGCLVLAIVIAIAASWRSIAALRRRPGACAACGYDRRGLAPDAICPECGNAPAQGNPLPAPRSESARA